VSAAGRVAVVLHEPELGGASVSLLRALPLLEARGWEFSFWVPGRGPAERELRRQGRHVTTAERLLRFSRASLAQPPGPARRLASVPAYLRGWRAWLRDQDADLIHANSILSVPELASRPAAGPPLVLHTHEVLPGGAKGLVTALLARRADVVVSVSAAAARALRAYGIESTVVYGAVPDPGPVPAARDDGPLVVGTLGTVSRRKGSDLFVAAARRVQERRNGIEFRMAGELVVGGERPWAEQVLAGAASSGIRHAGRVEPFAELPGWHVFVLPSRMDPCPLALLEAMAVGLPVVATSVGGIPEQVGTDGGVLVAPEDVDGLADAVLRLAASPELRARLGAAGRERALSLFSLETQAGALDRVYRRALADEAAVPPARAPRG
jgi:glycosyltransferase involved in cell wall biosynthesis